MPVYLPNASLLEVFNYKEIESNQILKENAEIFYKNKVDQLGAQKCLYVGQREYATVKFSDDVIDIIGSDDATTCHIVLLVDKTSKNCSLCHFDGSYMDEGLQQIVSGLKTLNPGCIKFDLYIIGGFVDNRFTSEKITHELFNLFIEFTDEFYLKLCAVTELNDIIENEVHYPNAYGLAYNIKTESFFKCNQFLDKGPDLTVRSARHFSQNGNMNIFDTVNSKLVIGPFDYDPIEQADRLTLLPEHILLKYFSTSPEQEPKDFILNLKKTFRIMIEHPEPCVTYFKDMKPFVYLKQDDGSWKLEN